MDTTGAAVAPVGGMMMRDELSAAALRVLSEAEAEYADHEIGYTAVLTTDALILARFALSIVDSAQNSHDIAKELAAHRQRTTYTCEVCGEPFEAWARKSQKPRTCSGKCRAVLFRREKKARTVSQPIFNAQDDTLNARRRTETPATR